MKKNSFFDEYQINNIKNLINKKEYDIALKEIDIYKDTYPKDQLGIVYESKALTGKRKLKEAEIILKNLLNSEIKKEYVYDSALLQLADVLRFQKKYEEAINYYKKILDKEKVTKEKNISSYALIKLVNIYTYEYKYDDAINIIDKHNIKTSKILIKKAEILYRMHKYEESSKVLIKLNDNDLYVDDLQQKNYLLAKNYLNNNEIEKATICINKCFIKKNKKYWQSYVVYAQIKSSMNKDDEAIEMCKETIKQYNLSEAKDALARIYIKIGMFDEAKNMVEILWNEFHNDNQKNYYLGKIALANSNYQEAEQYFENAINSNNKVSLPEMNYYLIVSKFRLKKYDEVLSLIDEYDNKAMSKYYKNHVMHDIKMIKSYINQEDDIYGYSINQLNNYNEQEAIDHIINKHFYNEDFNKNIITQEEDIIKLYYDIKNKLNKNNKIIKGFCDTYTIYYENIGDKNKYSSNYIEVICLPDTYNIITFYPSDKGKKIEEKQVVMKKTKKLSQIDKFYKRYGKV